MHDLPRAARRLLPLLLLLVPLLLALPLRPAFAAPRSLSGITIVLDPGHGGADFGLDPAGSGLREKELTLDIALRMREQLAALDATVYLTRSVEQYVTLNARVRFANALLFRPDNRADQGRLISVHLNSNRAHPELRRVEVLVDPEAAPPFDFAARMAAQLREATGGTVGYRDLGYPDGVHPADVAPVRWTYPRGQNVLTESAFLSNPAQAAQLRDPAFLDALARAHVTVLLEELGR